ncbi:hypothetical protein [Microbulbifer discodermiae]|uniref:hypothetical protein n=1 Tax=Microbulbifer sp. 2201CG32-9 TaxID=3232309 RepID=UPI00345C1010
MNREIYLTSLGDISPIHLSSYLEQMGWVKDGSIGSKAVVWHRAEKENYAFEVIQPVDIYIRGFTQKIHEAITSISEFEERNPSLVLDDILNFYTDLVKIRVVHNDVEDGSIPLADGVLLIEKSKDLLIASTLSTFKKKKFFSGSRSDDEKNFISKLRLGQTEVGSFIVSLISPITVKSNTEEEIDSTSLTRSVTTNLAKSLSSISSAIEQYSEDQDIFHFEEVVSEGVSANLCDALVGLSGLSKSRSFEVSIKLAGVELDKKNIITHHSFKPSQLPAIESASEYYKGNYVINGYTAFGLVTKMKRIPGDEFGEVTISSKVNDSDKNVTVQLELDDYWDAVHAHESESYVKCSGNLIVTPKTATLAEATRFGVSDNLDLFKPKPNK